ncbi:unnamed protein product [Durusdinium trenchii]|uniref:Uncharacterized protein n=1 Tax=Durusdinium trenchii TaxID=1381693 RepID=A0ABP0PZI9_9DINO
MGKTTLLKHLAARRLCVPEHWSVTLVQQEADATEVPVGVVDEVLRADRRRRDLLQREAEFVWIPKRASVQFAIQQALPHAKSFHFQLIQMGIHELTFDDRIEEEHQCTVMVDTVKLERCVKPDFHELALLVTVDVCWKFSDLIAFVACECRVLPSKVIILDGDSPMPEGAFVLQQLCSSFRATIFVNPLDTRQLIPKKLCDFGQAKDIRVAGVKVANPIFTDNALPSDSGFIRFAVRNPKWGSIRSVAVHNKTPLQCLVSMLLPDFDEPIPYITAQSVILDQSMPVCQLLEYEDIELHFSGFKPWPVTNLEYLIPFAPLVPQDPQFTVKIWVKGPFDYRAKICHVDKEWSVTKLAASYQVLHKSNLTMIAMQHGKAVDTRWSQVGGPAAILGTIADEEGVLESAVKARVQTILSKIDNATIRAHMHDDPQTFWGYLKQWANDAKLRLITPEELKAQKKAGRLEAKEHSSASSSVKNKKLSEATAEKVAIDTLHFVANNAAVKQIDLNGFAPDRTGIAIVTPEEAMKLEAEGDAEALDHVSRDAQELQKLCEELSSVAQDGAPEDGEDLDAMGAEAAEASVRKILCGLGFTSAMMDGPVHVLPFGPGDVLHGLESGTGRCWAETIDFSEWGCDCKLYIDIEQVKGTRMGMEIRLDNPCGVRLFLSTLHVLSGMKGFLNVAMDDSIDPHQTALQ